MIAYKSIEEEAADCRAAWAAMPDAVAGLHIHHEVSAELLTEPIKNRIGYILRNKPKDEQAARLRAMRPIPAQAWAEYERVDAPAWAEYERVEAQAWAEYERVKAQAWAEIHPAHCTLACPWNGRTLFPEVTA